MNLRDHDDECVHGYRSGHGWDSVAGLPKHCHGGAAVVIDYEAADVALDDVISVVYGASGRYVIDAALGVTA